MPGRRTVCAVTSPGVRLLAGAVLAAASIVGAVPESTAATAAGHRGPAVLAIGDSVMLGAQPCMEARGYDVDALGSRQASGAESALRAAAPLPPQVIVHTGTNGGADRSDLAAIMDAIGRGPDVIWVTIQLPDGTSRYTFEESTNRAIRSMPRRYPNAFVADWNALSDEHPGWTWGDGIHLTPDGCRGYTRMLARALREAAQTHHYVPMGRPLASGISPG